MSLETTMAQAAARDAEASWARHRKLCSQCGDRRRGAGRCPAGQRMHGEARELRQSAQASAQADRDPGPGQPALFELEGQ